MNRAVGALADAVLQLQRTLLAVDRVKLARETDEQFRLHARRQQSPAGVIEQIVHELAS